MSSYLGVVSGARSTRMAYQTTQQQVWKQRCSGVHFSGLGGACLKPKARNDSPLVAARASRKRTMDIHERSTSSQVW